MNTSTPAASARRDRQPGRDDVAVAAGGDPRQREPRRDRGEQQPRRCSPAAARTRSPQPARPRAGRSGAASSSSLGGRRARAARADGRRATRAARAGRRAPGPCSRTPPRRRRPRPVAISAAVGALREQRQPAARSSRRCRCRHRARRPARARRTPTKTALCASRIAAQASICARDGTAARLEPPEQRGGQRLRERDAEAGRAHDRDRLEHRRDARAVADPRAALLSDPRKRDAAGERDPEAGRGSGARGQERRGRDVGEPGRRRDRRAGARRLSLRSRLWTWLTHVDSLAMLAMAGIASASSGSGSWARGWPRTSRARRLRAHGLEPHRATAESGRSEHGGAVAETRRQLGERERRRDHDGRRRRLRSSRSCWARTASREGARERPAVHRHVHDRAGGGARGSATALGEARHPLPGCARDRLLAEGRGRDAHDHGRRRGGATSSARGRCSRRWGSWSSTSARSVTARW